MYAWFGVEAKSTVNRRGKSYRARIGVASAQTVQAKRQQPGRFRAALGGRHACRITIVGRNHRTSEGHQTSRQCQRGDRRLYRTATQCEDEV